MRLTVFVKVMDRLSQTQNAVDELVNIMFATLSYLQKKAGFKQIHHDLPITNMLDDFDDPATFEGMSRLALSGGLRTEC